MPQFRISFDIGRGDTKLIEIPKLLLTHGHLDHSAGVAYHVSQRSLRHHPPGEIYCPPEIAEPLDKILRLWGEIEHFEFQYTLVPVQSGELYPLKGNHYFRAHRTHHRVPSVGYTIVEKRQKLKEEFRHLPGHEIAKLKSQGKEMFFESLTPLITFSGDTQIEYVLENEDVQNSQVLFLECTYIDDRRPVERARKWGHIHLDEIVENAKAFEKVERLFLIHFSPRYRPEVIRETLQKRLPDWLFAKTTPFIV